MKFTRNLLAVLMSVGILGKSTTDALAQPANPTTEQRNADAPTADADGITELEKSIEELLGIREKVVGEFERYYLNPPEDLERQRIAQAVAMALKQKTRTLFEKKTGVVPGKTKPEALTPSNVTAIETFLNARERYLDGALIHEIHRLLKDRKPGGREQEAQAAYAQLNLPKKPLAEWNREQLMELHRFSEFYQGTAKGDEEFRRVRNHESELAAKELAVFKNNPLVQQGRLDFARQQLQEVGTLLPEEQERVLNVIIEMMPKTSDEAKQAQQLLDRWRERPAPVGIPTENPDPKVIAPVTILPEENEMIILKKARYNELVRAHEIYQSRIEIIDVRLQISAMERLLEAKLELVEDPKERLLIMKHRLKVLKEMETFAEDRYARGGGDFRDSPTDLPEARARRLKAQIEVLQLERELEKQK